MVQEFGNELLDEENEDSELRASELRMKDETDNFCQKILMAGVVVAFWVTWGESDKKFIGNGERNLLEIPTSVIDDILPRVNLKNGD